MKEYGQNSFILGIDVGSVSVSLVQIDQTGSLTDHKYALHHGDIRSSLEKLLGNYKPEQILGIAAPSGKTPFHRQIRIYDTQVSLMAAISHLSPLQRLSQIASSPYPFCWA